MQPTNADDVIDLTDEACAVWDSPELLAEALDRFDASLDEIDGAVLVGRPLAAMAAGAETS